MLRKINHWIDWWQYHHSPPWSSPSLCLSRTVLVVLPKDNWSSITSSNSWWNCISFFSSPNLPNHVTPVSKYSDAATCAKGGIGAASSISTSPPFQSSSRHRWRKKIFKCLEEDHILIQRKIATQVEKDNKQKTKTDSRTPVHAKIEVAAGEVDPHRLKISFTVEVFIFYLGWALCVSESFIFEHRAFVVAHVEGAVTKPQIHLEHKQSLSFGQISYSKPLRCLGHYVCWTQEQPWPLCSLASQGIPPFSAPGKDARTSPKL